MNEPTDVTLRDHFAGMALTGMIAEPPPTDGGLTWGHYWTADMEFQYSTDRMAFAAYRMADAMLRARSVNTVSPDDRHCPHSVFDNCDCFSSKAAIARADRVREAIERAAESAAYEHASRMVLSERVEVALPKDAAYNLALNHAAAALLRKSKGEA